MAAHEYKPLKITWTFREAVGLSAHPIHLDALLAWASVKRSIDAGNADLLPDEDGSTAKMFAAQENLPLARTGTTWHASMLRFTPLGESFLFPVTRKYPLHMFARNMGILFEGQPRKDAISDGSGIYKGFDMRFPAQQMKCAVAWCVGDKEAIQDLLRDVLSIGPRHQKGLGRVASVTVEDCPVNEIENWRVRVLPVGSGLETDTIKYALAYGRAFPPYWDRVCQEEVLVPTI